MLTEVIVPFSSCLLLELLENVHLMEVFEYIRADSGRLHLDL